MSEVASGDVRDTVASGVGIAITFHLLQLLVIFVTTFVYHPKQPDLALIGFALAITGWSAMQFLYLGPIAWWFWRKGQKQRMNGVLIVAGIAVLLNGACDALVFLPGRR